jgi:hypothetical protein
MEVGDGRNIPGQEKRIEKGLRWEQWYSVNPEVRHQRD